MSEYGRQGLIEVAIALSCLVVSAAAYIGVCEWWHRRHPNASLEEQRDAEWVVTGIMGAILFCGMITACVWGYGQ